MAAQPLLSQVYPNEVESRLHDLTFGASDILVEELWEEALDSYSEGKYLGAVILAGACAETAHRFKCRFRGMNTQGIHWVHLIEESRKLGVITEYTERILTRIRTSYRNKWVHVDIDRITQNLPIPSTASTVSSPTVVYVHETTPDEYRSIFASLSAKQEALDCLWLTAIALFTIYGGMGFLLDPAA